MRGSVVSRRGLPKPADLLGGLGACTSHLVTSVGRNRLDECRLAEAENAMTVPRQFINFARVGRSPNGLGTSGNVAAHSVVGSGAFSTTECSTTRGRDAWFALFSIDRLGAGDVVIDFVYGITRTPLVAAIRADGVAANESRAVQLQMQNTRNREPIRMAPFVQKENVRETISNDFRGRSSG